PVPDTANTCDAQYAYQRPSGDQRGGLEEVSVSGHQVDEAHVDQFPVGTGNRHWVNAELRGYLRPGGKLAPWARLPILHRAQEQVGGLDPGAGVVAAGADGHHVILAQTIRSSPVTCTPQSAGPPDSASTTLIPCGRSSS